MSAVIHARRPHTYYTVCGREFDPFKPWGAKRMADAGDPDISCRSCLRRLSAVEKGPEAGSHR